MSRILSNEEIISAAVGAAYCEADENGVRFHRFTREQEELYDTLKPQHRNKVRCPAGVRIRFKTDSRTLKLLLAVHPGHGNRSYFSVEVFSDGKPAGVIDNFTNTAAGDSLHEKYPTGIFARPFAIGKEEGESLIEIFLPSLSLVTLVEMELDDGATFTPVKREKTLIAFGDSITQGYDAFHPSRRYAARLADYLGADEICKAIGGEIFFPELGGIGDGIEPDYITVAYGTNDWSHLGLCTFADNCRRFFENLRRTYPGARIFAITPIWRADWQSERAMGGFDEVGKQIRAVAADLDGVTVIDGFDLVPHDTSIFADGSLHPNDAGFDQYAGNLVAAFKNSIGIGGQ